MDVLTHFSLLQFIAVVLVFIWTGFVRSGLGFGGAALGLPLMLFIYDQPLFWLPVIGSHLLFFSALTLRNCLHDVDWAYLKRAISIIIPFTLMGVFGLIKLPNQILLMFIFGITLLYALLWVAGKAIKSNSVMLDRVLLMVGGYIAGTSLTGAPIIVAVFIHNVKLKQLRNTLFVLWFLIVSIKMSAFVVVGIDLQLLSGLVLIPVAAIGHVVGLRAHQMIMQNDKQFKRIMGVVLMFISLLGIYKIY